MLDSEVIVHLNEMAHARDSDCECIDEHRRRRERIRKQEARKRQTLEQRERERVRKREARKRQTRAVEPMN
jgi:hypothetical protein